MDLDNGNGPPVEAREVLDFWYGELKPEQWWQRDGAVDGEITLRSLVLYQILDDPDQLDFARKHKEIIDRFGRFPYRNKVLGRVSTPREEEFLEKPGVFW